MQQIQEACVAEVMNCPNDEKLAMLAEGRLAAPELELVEAHLDKCASCRTLVAAASNGSIPAAANGAVALKPGDRLGRYEIERWLATGGMGVLYVARDTQLDRRVALKLMRGTIGDEIAHVRLLREAQAMAALNHPNVLQVFELGELDGRVFVAMEFVEGGTLRGWMKRSHPWREVVEMFVLIGRGLQTAHERGVVHRDFKPENVLMGDNRPRVGDFGLSRPAPSMKFDPTTPVPMQVTQHGMMLGTPAYMSPEQLQGRAADAASDQYSFCVCLYEALTLRRPFAGKSVEELKHSVRGEMPIPQDPSEVPRELWKILARGLAFDAAARFPNMSEMLDALSRTLGSRAEAPPAHQRYRWPAVIAVGCLAVAAASSVFPRGISLEEVRSLAVAPTGFQTAGLSNGSATAKEKGSDALPPSGRQASGSEPQSVPSNKNVEYSSLVLKVDQTKRLVLGDVSKVAIGDPETADLRVADSGHAKAFDFVGKKVGVTTVLVWLEDGTRISIPVVVEPAEGSKVKGKSPAEKIEISSVVLNVGISRSWSFGERFTRVTIGDAEIADAWVDDGSLNLSGKKVGETTAIVWLASGRRISFTVTVRPPLGE